MLVDQQLKVKEIHIQNVGCHPLRHLELNKIVAYWVVKRSFNIWSVSCSENVFDRFLELYKGNRVNVLKKPFTENGFYQPPLLKLDLNVIFSLAKITLHFDSTVSKERRNFLWHNFLDILVYSILDIYFSISCPNIGPCPMLRVYFAINPQGYSVRNS